MNRIETSPLEFQIHTKKGKTERKREREEKGHKNSSEKNKIDTMKLSREGKTETIKNGTEENMLVDSR